MKILLIDDDEWIRDSLRLFFEAEGCPLLALETAEEGLVALWENTYDIIIVDYKLPGLNGIEFLKRIRFAHSDAIKILITAYRRDRQFLKQRSWAFKVLLKNTIYSIAERPKSCSCTLFKFFKSSQAV